MSDRRIRAAAVLLLAVGLAGEVWAVPSFSGAEGWGAITPGGRGGEVIHVTNLNDSGPGSFREAVTAAGARTVVFDVAGTIQLESEIAVTNPFLTIAGQTATGGGVTIAGETVSLDTSDIVVRYMRFRRGAVDENRRDDALGSDRTPGNIVVDHSSVSWGLDENLSIYRWKNEAGNVLPTHNVTIQWSISSEALNPFDHAFGATWGGKGVNYHHNLFASNTGRNPSISWSHMIDYRNNAMFNWQHRTIDGAGPEAHVNLINNYYKPGPATDSGELQHRIVKPEIRSGVPGDGAAGWWYVEGNHVVGNPAVTADNWDGGVQFELPMQEEWVRSLEPMTSLSIPLDPRDPFDQDVPELPVPATQSAVDAFQSILAGAGASLVRDAVDERTINSVTTGVATAGPNGDGIINHPDDVGGYPVISFVQRGPDFDTDGDGMPSEWEVRHGLDPDDPADRNSDFDTDGFTNLEEYLNELGAFPAVQEIVWDDELGNGRYAQIENWDLAFQPSRFDTAVINNGTVVVDAIGQNAGTLKLATEASGNATLNITNGWLNVAEEVTIGQHDEATAVLGLSGGELRTPRLAKGNGGSFEFTGGTLRAGEVAFDLVNDGGTIAPGDSPGVTHVGGGLTINNGALEIELASAEDHDQVSVDDSAALAGELEVVLLDGFEPAAGTEFEIVAAGGGVSGQFETLTAPALNGRMWRLEYGATSVQLVALVAGDYNADGVVDAADYTVWRDMLGQSGAGLAADGDGDGMIDTGDYDEWVANFGVTAAAAAGSAGAAAALPEPHVLTIGLSGLAIINALRRRDRAGKHELCR